MGDDTSADGNDASPQGAVSVIDRPVYRKRLESRAGNGMVKVITGLRRCGKSFLLFTIFANALREGGVADDHIIRIQLDNDRYADCRDPGRLSAYIRDRLPHDGKMCYVMIDEAQFAITREEMRDRDNPIRLYGILNGLLYEDNVDVYITGSNSKFLSTDVMTEFRGRGDEIHIAPLSFSEFLPASGLDKSDAWRDYTYYGGLPHILAERTPEDKTRYLTRLNREIYLRDVCERYNLRNPEGMEEVMQVTASAIGSPTNPRRLADTFRSNGTKGVSEPTVRNYLAYLEEAFILERAERYDIKGRRYIGSNHKYYYTDTGLRNALLGFRQYEPSHLMENVIYNELVCRGYSVDVGVVNGYGQSRDGKTEHRQYEIDFVASLGSRRYYIQSAYALSGEGKMEQEQASLVRIPDSFRKIIVTAENMPTWHTENGVTVISLFDFLLNPLSLDQ